MVEAGIFFSQTYPALVKVVRFLENQTMFFVDNGLYRADWTEKQHHCDDDRQMFHFGRPPFSNFYALDDNDGEWIETITARPALLIDKHQLSEKRAR